MVDGAEHDGGESLELSEDVDGVTVDLGGDEQPVGYHRCEGASWRTAAGSRSGNWWPEESTVRRSASWRVWRNIPRASPSLRSGDGRRGGGRHGRRHGPTGNGHLPCGKRAGRSVGKVGERHHAARHALRHRRPGNCGQPLVHWSAFVRLDMAETDPAQGVNW